MIRSKESVFMFLGVCLFFSMAMAFIPATLVLGMIPGYTASANCITLATWCGIRFVSHP